MTVLVFVLAAAPLITTTLAATAWTCRHLYRTLPRTLNDWCDHTTLTLHRLPLTGHLYATCVHAWLIARTLR